MTITPEMPHPWLTAPTRREARATMRALLRRMEDLVADGCPPGLAWRLIFQYPVFW